MNDNNNKKKKEKKSFFKEVKQQLRQQTEQLEVQTIRNYQQMREQAAMNAIAAENACSTRATQQRMFDAIQEMLEAHGCGHELKKGWKKFANF